MKLKKKFFIILFLLCIGCSKEDKKDEVLMENFINKNISLLTKYATNNKINLETNYEYSNEVQKDIIISQSIKKGTKIKKNDKLVVIVSLGKIDKERLSKDNINELGKVPIMMYHGIVNKKNNETEFTGGNVDKNGYNRTVESFRKDLEFYYQEGYRMVRLIDYVNGDISTEYGKSPIILTFDDGNENNLKVTGLDDKGNIIIDENSAVGVLESFKKKYPDYNITATFFVNGGLFNQKEYNEKILNWLVDNGYDVGNHTKEHINIANETASTVENNIGYVYNELDRIIPNKYVNIVALPFGSPYNKTHANYSHVLKSVYNNKEYLTISALRVGWEPEASPYDKKFDKEFLKRCRAYDNNGKEFDIEMVFNNLNNNKYISDGNKNTIVTNKKNETIINNSLNKKLIIY